jgi:P4 family phage/plasmid primase-like protien
MVDKKVIQGWVNYWYGTIGVNVIPIALKAKLPLKGFGWAEWQDKPQPKELIDELINSGKFDGGLAIITGRIWRGRYEGKHIAGIDLDNAKAVEVVAPILNCKDLNELGNKTVVVLHKDKPYKGHVMIVSEIPISKKELEANLTDVDPKIEVKGSSDQMIHCPHSIHVDGYAYEIIGVTQPLVLTIDQTNAFVQKLDQVCKQHGLEYLDKVGRKAEISWDTTNEGNRDKQAFTNALDLLRRGLKPDMVLEALLSWDRKNNPPLGDNIIKAKVSSALRYVDNPQVPGTEEQQQKEGEKKKEDPVWSKLATKYTLQYNLVARADTKEIFMYDADKGLYVKAEDIVRRDLRREKHADKTINEVLKAIADLEWLEPSKFDAQPNKIHIQNGWLDTETKTFEEHTPDYYSFAKLAPIYDPNAKCEKALAFIKQVVAESDIEVIQKLFGYLLKPGNAYKKAFLFIGDKDTGKTTLIRLMESFVGGASHVSLHDLENSENRKIVSAAYSLLNTTSEIAGRKIKDDMLFKQWTGNDEISFRRLFEEPFNARFMSKFVMAANDLPNFADADRAFVERWVLVRFDNVINSEDQDLGLFEKITSKEELSGLLNWAIEGLKKLEQDNYFRQETWAQVQEKWKENSSKINSYLAKNTVKGEFKIEPADLYSDYEDYCKLKGEQPLTLEHFGREIKRQGFVRKQVGPRKAVKWFYIGLTTVKRKDSGEVLSGSTITLTETEKVALTTETIKQVLKETGEVQVDEMLTYAKPINESKGITEEDCLRVLDQLKLQGHIREGGAKGMIVWQK